MPSYVKRYVAETIIGNACFLEIVNESDLPALSIALQLLHQGSDVTHLVCAGIPKTLAPRARALPQLTAERDPQDVDVTLSWTDQAGIPGQRMGPVRRY